MTDIVTIPKEFWPTIDELPGDLAQFARDIEEIAPGLGVKLIIHLEPRYRSTALYFHTLKKCRDLARNKRIVERYSAGEKVNDLARDVGLSTRQIWNILGREPGEDKQMKLF